MNYDEVALTYIIMETHSNMNAFCLQNVEDQVDMSYLRTFQSVILQRQSLASEGTFRLNHPRTAETKKNALLVDAEGRNRDCYKEGIRLLASHDKLVSAVEKGCSPSRRLLCTKEKDYLGSTYIYIMRVLLMLREDKGIFKYLLDCVENAGNFAGRPLDEFAEELVFLFFADFSSDEKHVVSILRHLECLLHVCPPVFAARV